MDIPIGELGAEAMRLGKQIISGSHTPDQMRVAEDSVNNICRIIGGNLSELLSNARRDIGVGQ